MCLWTESREKTYQSLEDNVFVDWEQRKDFPVSEDRSVCTASDNKQPNLTF